MWLRKLVEPYTIPQVIKSGNYQFTDTEVGFIFPDYGLCVPPYIRDFLYKVKIESQYVFAVITYGFYKGAVVHDLLSGTCTKVCPVDTIKLQDNKPVFSAHCISCHATKYCRFQYITGYILPCFLFRKN